MTSWKTSLFGVLVGIATMAHFIWPAVITLEILSAITGILTIALGLSAKDSQITGGTVVNATNDPAVVKDSATK